MGIEFEAHSVVTCAALYKAVTFCKQEMKRYLSQLEKGQVSVGLAVEAAEVGGMRESGPSGGGGVAQGAMGL